MTSRHPSIIHDEQQLKATMLDRILRHWSQRAMGGHYKSTVHSFTVQYLVGLQLPRYHQRFLPTDSLSPLFLHKFRSLEPICSRCHSYEESWTSPIACSLDVCRPWRETVDRSLYCICDSLVSNLLISDKVVNIHKIALKPYCASIRQLLNTISFSLQV